MSDHVSELYISSWHAALYPVSAGCNNSPVKKLSIAVNGLKFRKVNY